MIKQLFMAMAIVVFVLVTLAFAEVGQLAVDGLGVRVPGFAPDATKEVSLNGTRQTVDNRNDAAWYVYCAAESGYRTMSTATRAGIKKTIPGASWHGRVVNRSGSKVISPYTNISGCTGVMERQ